MLEAAGLRLPPPQINTLKEGDRKGFGRRELLGVLLAERLGGRHKVGESGLGLGPLAGLQTTVGVDPELVGAQVLEHLLDTVLDLLLAGDTGRVDVVDTGTDVAGVGLVDEHLEQLGVRLAVLDGQDIGIQSGNGVEEVLELGVTEVGVDLGTVGDTGSGQTEGVDGPLEVLLTLSTGTEGQTLTQSRLVDLDDLDTGSLEVNNLVAQSESELLGLDGLVNVVTGERPAQTGDRASQHTLHGLVGNRHGVLGLLDGHGVGTRDVTNNDGGTDATRTVRLDPGVGGEDVTSQALTEVLDHVVTLGLTVDQDIEAKVLLDLDNVADLLLDELLVLLGSDLTLGELVTLDTDLLGLGEGTDGGGGEEREVDGLALLGNTGGEGRLAVVLLGGDGSLAGLDGGVVGALGGGAGLDRLGVGLELLLDGSGAVGDSLGDHDNLGGLLDGKGEPVTDLGVEGLLALKGVGDVEQGAGGGNDNTVLAELLDGELNLLNGGLEVGLPDVTAIDNTSGEDLLGAESGNDGVELLGVADQVDVDSVDVLGESLNVVDNVTEVGGEGDLGGLVTEVAQLLIGGLESGLGLGGKVEDEDGLVNLDVLNASGLQLSKELNVDGQELVELSDGVNALATVGLGEDQEGDGTQDNGAGDDTGLLGLEVLDDGLGVGSQLEGLVVLQGGLDVVVVGVKPFHHFLELTCQQPFPTLRERRGTYQRGDIDTLLLETTAHGEVLIDGVQVVLAVALGDGTEELDVVEDLVVEGKVVAGDAVDASTLLDLPVLLTETLALSEQVITGDLAAPVGFRGLLQVTEPTHTGETENGPEPSVNRTNEGQRGE